MAKFNDKNYTKLWLKEKTRKVFKDGEKYSKGDEITVYQGTLQLAGNKRLTFECYSTELVQNSKGEYMLPLKVSKWESKRTQLRKKSTLNW